MLVFFPMAQYSTLIELDELPSEGDQIIITEENLEQSAGGVDSGIYGCTLTAGKRLEDQGWSGNEVTYPSFSACITP